MTTDSGLTLSLLPSISSSSSNSSSRSSSQFSSTKARVPFSWEYLPGIPKNSTFTISPPRPPPPPPSLVKPIMPPPKSQFSLPLPPSSYTWNKNPSVPNAAGLAAADSRTKSGCREKVGGGSPSSRGISISSWRDPFIAALIECSRDALNNDSTNNNRRRSGYKSGFLMRNLIGLDQFSCKRSCGVAEYSIVQLPRRSRRLAYN